MCRPQPFQAPAPPRGGERRGWVGVRSSAVIRSWVHFGGEGAALRWEPGGEREGRAVYPARRSLIPGCFAEGGGRLWGESGFVCPPLFSSPGPHPGPPSRPESPRPGGQSRV